MTPSLQDGKKKREGGEGRSRNRVRSSGRNMVCVV